MEIPSPIVVHIEWKTYDLAPNGRKEGFFTFKEKSRHKSCRLVASAVVVWWMLDVLGSSGVRLGKMVKKRRFGRTLAWFKVREN